nr:hypothetical protein [Anaerocolumna jejuensis]
MSESRKDDMGRDWLAGIWLIWPGFRRHVPDRHLRNTGEDSVNYWKAVR